MMTIIILYLYHSSGFKNFKFHYFHLLQHHSEDFPQLLSYSRFVDCRVDALLSYFSLCISKGQGHRDQLY